MSVIKIVKKILNLIAHQKSAEGYGNFAEAKLYADRAEALKRKHGITQELINETTRTNERNFEFIFDHNHKYYRRRRIIWQEEMTKPLVHFYGCQLGIRSGNNLKVVIGEKSGRKKIVHLYLHFHKTAEESADKFMDLMSSQIFGIGKKHYRKLRQSFLLGFSEGVQNRVYGYKSLEDVIKKLEAEIKQNENEIPVEPSKQIENKDEQKTLNGNVEVNENKCVALVKSERITIRQEKTQTPPVSYPQVKKPAESKIQDIVPDSYVAGVQWAFQSNLPENFKAEVEILIEKVNALKAIRREQEDKKRKANWEENFISRGHFYGWGGSRATSSTYYQPGFDWGKNDAV